ncbi:MAG: hypothetical protein ACSHXI_06895 [Hoeflea sp.]|uniref:hypothetical protein n=1 Tax=Hoeflea sp. TaxID=1940281 RepID=UPI003EFA6F97
MLAENRRKLEQVLYVQGAIKRLMQVAEKEQFSMLGYLLELVDDEAKQLETMIRNDRSDPSV